MSVALVLTIVAFATPSIFGLSLVVFASVKLRAMTRVATGDPRAPDDFRAFWDIPPLLDEYVAKTGDRVGVCAMLVAAISGIVLFVFGGGGRDTHP